MVKSKKALLVAIEGIDGSGKTTISLYLASKLKEIGFKVIYSKEPTDGPYGQQIRKQLSSSDSDIKKLIDLYTLDRIWQKENIILPYIKIADIILLDRYIFTPMAYERALGYTYEEVLERNKFIIVPDIVILLDLDPKVAINRIKKEKNKLDRFEDIKFLDRVRTNYIEITKIIKKFKNWGNVEIYIIDASKPITNIKKTVLDIVINTYKKLKTKKISTRT